ncbi:MAG: leucine-rich repeat protein [Clostridia bacterium]|nr:leucine-rich repeat protein [Clostridia bacterium]
MNLADLEKVEELVFPENTTYICSEMLSPYKNLKTVDLSKTLITEIPPYTFAGELNSTIEKLILPPTLKVLGTCPSFVKELYIPASVEKIDKFALEFVKGVMSFVVDEENPYFSSEDGALYNKDKTKLIRYPAGKKISKVELPSTVTTLEHSAFSFVHLVSEIVVPPKVKTISEDAFFFCKVDNIVLPPKLQAIKKDAFHCCAIKDGLQFPSTVRKFGRCMLDCFEQDELVLPEGLSEISKGAFIRSKIKTIIFPNTVKRICELGINSCNVNNLVLQSGLEEIMEYGISYCYELEYLYIPDTVNYIDHNALRGNINLERITVNEKNPYFKVEDDNILIDIRDGHKYDLSKDLY